MKLTPVGIDIAKMVVQEETGEIVNKPVKRAAFLDIFREPAVVPRRNGGARRCAPLGTETVEEVFGSKGACICVPDGCG